MLVPLGVNDGGAVLLWFFSAWVWASPAPVVVLGPPAVFGPPAALASVEATPAGGGVWALGLSDCLEERAPGRWTIIDRASPSATLGELKARLGSVGPVGGGLMILGARAPSASLDLKAKEALQGFVTELLAAKFTVLLVPLLSQAAPEEVLSWNGALKEWASTHDRVRWVLVRPSEVAAWFTADGAALSADGTARLTAAVCDSVLTRTGSAK